MGKEFLVLLSVYRANDKILKGLGVRLTLDEMRQFGCLPIYNLLLHLVLVPKQI